MRRAGLAAWPSRRRSISGPRSPDRPPRHQQHRSRPPSTPLPRFPLVTLRRRRRWPRSLTRGKRRMPDVKGRVGLAAWSSRRWSGSDLTGQRASAPGRRPRLRGGSGLCGWLRGLWCTGSTA